jgi:hypothetical protein
MALTARKIAEQEGRFAMELDLPLWATGKFFCHEYNVECELCTLNDVCPKIDEYCIFWTKFKKALAEAGIEREHTPKPVPRFDTTMGIQHVQHVFIQNVIGDSNITAQIYIKNCEHPFLFNRLLQYKAKIETDSGVNFAWNDIGLDKKIGISKVFNLSDKNMWPEVLEWLVIKNLMMLRVFPKYIIPLAH